VRQGISRTAPESNEYILGVNEDERTRLLAQAELHAPEARVLLDRVGVAPGWRTIDVGCGPLGVLDLLAERVGPTGTVVGLDRDERMLAMAARSLAERELQHVRLVQAPADETGVSESFDLCHARLVLVHAPNPSEVVAEMVAITRPGGWVALEEIDWISWVCEPPHPAFERLVGALTRVWARAGLDVHIGRRAEGMLRSAGLDGVEACAHQKLCRPGDLNQRMILGFAAIARERLVAADEFTAAQLDELVAELAEHLARPGTVVLDKLLFQAWGRKPE
jgi:SAM-dependent methyltransferase